MNILTDTLRRQARKVWAKISPPINKFWEIDGEQRAAAFGYYAFFSVFPLVLLLVTLGSFFVDRGTATTAILDYLRQYIPLTEDNQQVIFETINGVIDARGGVGVVAFLFLLYGALRFFYVLVRGINLAWGMEQYSWWRLPLQNLMLLGILITALTFGLLAPTVLRLVQNWIPIRAPGLSWLFDLALLLLPVVVMFYSFTMLYKLAPRRQRPFSEVWGPALLVALLLWAGEHLFVMYFQKFGDWNALYGAFGAIMAFLLWIYISGVIILLGGCICATWGREDDPP